MEREPGTPESESRGVLHRYFPMLVFSICVLVVLVVVVVPEIKRYFRKSADNEATINLDKIKGGARQYYVTDRRDENGNLLPRGFPSNITMTPSTGPHCEKMLRTPTTTWDTHG